MEPALAAHDAAGHAARVHAVLWPRHGSLYYIPVLRQPRVRLLQRIHLAGHELPHGQRRHLYQGQCPEVPLPAVEERPVPHQLRPDAMRLRPLLYSGRYHLHMALDHAALPHRAARLLQHRHGAHPLRALRLLPRHPVPLEHLYPAADVHVGDLLFHRDLRAERAEPVSLKPRLPLHPLFPQDRHRGGCSLAVVPRPHACGHAYRRRDRLLHV